MKTLAECIEARKCRKGKATGTTRQGAYWLACEPIVIRNYGGDGIGNSAADCKHYLELRHFRDGNVMAVVHGHFWHQNGARPDIYEHCSGLTSCKTVEEVIVYLKKTKIDDETTTAYSDYYADTLTAALVGLGLAECEPGPDEAV
jgi:hypothetical protein